MQRDEVVKVLRQLPLLQWQVEKIENALAALTEEEYNILATLYLHPKRNNVDVLCEKLEVERTTVYRRRDKALKKLGNLLQQ